MKTRHKRLILIVVGVLGLTIGGMFVLNAFRSNLVYFYSPTEVLEGKAPRDQTIRIGGMVEKGSVKRAGDSLVVQFVVTDMNKSIPVRYEGILPDLFRDGQGVVTLGRMGTDGTFAAREVLAKHDENYMPPEAAAAMKGGAFQSGK
ncbi:MAG: cytochrome C biogenesis protein CcmE [Acidithiobacillales bacterium SM23_46]|jgi:cytochrome c-type biogenesis protein CcmE|nr:MAG: cytochrome C biogenesis protein CcmE [Acidithiobacillales bacterium SM23_46]